MLLPKHTPAIEMRMPITEDQTFIPVDVEKDDLALYSHIPVQFTSDRFHRELPFEYGPFGPEKVTEHIVSIRLGDVSLRGFRFLNRTWVLPDQLAIHEIQAIRAGSDYTAGVVASDGSWHDIIQPIVTSHPDMPNKPIQTSFEKQVCLGAFKLYDKAGSVLNSVA